MTNNNECVELGQMILQLYKATDKAVAVTQLPETRPVALDYIEALEFAAHLSVPALGPLATDARSKAIAAKQYIIDKDDWASARRALLAAGATLEEAIFKTVINCACDRKP